MKKYYILVAILVFLLAVVFLLYAKPINKNGYNGIESAKVEKVSTVEVDGTIFKVVIADTEKEMNRGLSGRKKLEKNQGMLFVFEKSGVYPFWMKDMNFPIDIIWIDEDFKVVYIKENATPESYPETFTSYSPARYALEVASGVTKNNKIKIGDNVILNISDAQ